MPSESLERLSGGVGGSPTPALEETLRPVTLVTPLKRGRGGRAARAAKALEPISKNTY